MSVTTKSYDDKFLVWLIFKITCHSHWKSHVHGYLRFQLSKWKRICSVSRGENEPTRNSGRALLVTLTRRIMIHFPQSNPSISVRFIRNGTLLHQTLWKCSTIPSQRCLAFIRQPKHSWEHDHYPLAILFRVSGVACADPLKLTRTPPIPFLAFDSLATNTGLLQQAWKAALGRKKNFSNINGSNHLVKVNNFWWDQQDFSESFQRRVQDSTISIFTMLVFHGVQGARSM